MRVHTVSDIHVDYAQNFDWLMGLSESEYRSDVLLLAGDVSDDFALLETVLAACAARFAQVLFVPGNHDLWVRRCHFDCSLTKFTALNALCDSLGIKTQTFLLDGVAFVPLLSWYDFSFGELSRELRRGWRDFSACHWPDSLSDSGAVANYFHALNEAELVRHSEVCSSANVVISCSHFLPTLAAMPSWVPESRRVVYPVLGSAALGDQVERLAPAVHVYGHSHVNQAVQLGETCYVNNAFATPNETRIAVKRLQCIYDSENASVLPQLVQAAKRGLLWS